MLDLVQKSLAELERTKGKKIISQRDSQCDRRVKENGRKEGRKETVKVFMFGSVINTCFSFMIKLRFVAGWREIVTVLSLYSSYVALTSGQFHC